MYLEAGESMKAIEALAQLKSAERLIEIARKLDKGDRKALIRCAELLSELGQTAACGEIYGKFKEMRRTFSNRFIRLSCCVSSGSFYTSVNY